MKQIDVDLYIKGNEFGPSYRLYINKEGKALLIFLTEANLIEESRGLIETVESDYDIPFSFLVFGLEEKDIALPFSSHSPFGKNTFIGEADKTVISIRDTLDALKEKEPSLIDLPVILGGYSLCGLLALYAGYVSEEFPYIAACSPSLWYEGWMEFAKNNKMNASEIYISLGDKEEKSKNKLFSHVGDVAREYFAYLESLDYRVNLVWNKGGHFYDPEQRMADGFGSLLITL